MANVVNPTVAPAPRFPEVAGNVFERTLGPDMPGERGPLRFEEGIATDTDVPTDFAIGRIICSCCKDCSINRSFRWK